MASRLVAGGGGMFSVFADFGGWEEAAVLAHDALADGLAEILDVCLAEANETCPIEEGTLIASGTVHLDRASLQGSITYATPYAIVQHEDTSLHHDPGRRARWLVLTMEENADRYEEYLRVKAAERLL